MANGCQFEPRDAMVFAFEFKGDTHQNNQALAGSAPINAQGKKSQNTMRLTGGLTWETQGQHQDLWLIYAQLKEIQFKRPDAAAPQGTTMAQAEQMLQMPFALKLDSKCRFHSFGFLPSIHPDVREQIRSFFQSMEYIMPEE